MEHLQNCAELANAKWEKAKILDINFICGHLLIDAIKLRCLNFGIAL